MKKIAILSLSLFLLASCEKDCGCFAPATKRTETKILGVPPYQQTYIEYFGKYRDDCGNTKEVHLNKQQYDIWPMVPDICD